MSTFTELTPAQQTAREIWTSGDYPEVADRLIRGFGPTLVEELKIHGGQQVLDIACGAGNVAIPAAKAGADVTGVDITPVLLERGADNAAAAGVDGRLDRGRRRGAAVPRRELRRRDERRRRHVLPVAREGGGRTRPRVPSRRLDRARRLDARGPDRLDARRPRAVRAAAPAGAQPGPLWGTEEHVRALIGTAVTDLRNERRRILFDGFTPDSFVDFMRVNYGPVLRIFNRLADDPGRTRGARRRAAPLRPHARPRRAAATRASRPSTS